MLLDISDFNHLNTHSPETFQSYLRLICLAIRQKESPSDTPIKLRNNQVLVYERREEWFAVDELILCGVLERVPGTLKDMEANVYKLLKLKQISITNHPQYKEFIKRFNEITSKKSRGDKSSKKIFAEAFEKYGIQEIHKAIYRAKMDSFHQENGMKYLTPEYILRDKILDRYLSMPDPKAPEASTGMFSGN